MTQVEDFGALAAGTLLQVKVDRDDAKRKHQDKVDDEIPQKRRKTDHHGDDKIVWVRGMPWSVNESELRQFFKGIDILSEDGVLLVLNHSGRPTGEAFLRVQNESDVKAALALHKASMGSRYIEVYESTEVERSKAQSRSQSFKEAAAAGGGHHGHGHGGGAARASAAAAAQPYSASSAVTRLRGLPFSASDKDLRSFFAGLEIVGTHIMSDHLGRPSGEAFVEFPNEDTARQAQAFDRRTIGSRYIEVFASTMGDLRNALARHGHAGAGPAGRFQHQQQHQHGFQHGHGHGHPHHQQHQQHQQRHVRGGGSAPPPPAPAPSRMFSAKGGRRSVESPYLRMLGLPFDSNETDITRFFQEAGVTPTRIHRHQQGGVAYVEFASTGDARAGMSKDKGYIGRRYIELFSVDYEEMAEAVGLPPQPPPFVSSAAAAPTGVAVGAVGAAAPIRGAPVTYSPFVEMPYGGYVPAAYAYQPAPGTYYPAPHAHGHGHGHGHGHAR